MNRIPVEYLDYASNLTQMWGETDLEFGGYFELEPIENIEKMNQEIEMQKYAPEYIAFASNGGGEIFAFNSNGEIFLLPLIGLKSEVAVKISSSWPDFCSHITKA